MCYTCYTVTHLHIQSHAYLYAVVRKTLIAIPNVLFQVGRSRIRGSDPITSVLAAAAAAPTLSAAEEREDMLARLRWDAWMDKLPSPRPISSLNADEFVLTLVDTVAAVSDALLCIILKFDVAMDLAAENTDINLFFEEVDEPPPPEPPPDSFPPSFHPPISEFGNLSSSAILKIRKSP